MRLIKLNTKDYDEFLDIVSGWKTPRKSKRK
jgi:hypothetical protein